MGYLAMPPRARLEVTKPKQLVDTKKFMRGLERAVDDTTAIAKANFEATVKSWKRKVRFKRTRAARRGSAIEGSVTTGDEIYGYVSGGTGRHPIPKRPTPRGRPLRFRTGYRAKTRRRVLGSHKGGAYGGWRSKRQVMHPGTEAREFEKEIAARRRRNLRNFVLRAWVEARR
jgi:hypothetical protein